MRHFLEFLLNIFSSIIVGVEMQWLVLSGKMTRRTSPALLYKYLLSPGQTHTPFSITRLKMIRLLVSPLLSVPNPLSLDTAGGPQPGGPRPGPALGILSLPLPGLQPLPLLPGWPPNILLQPPPSTLQLQLPSCSSSASVLCSSSSTCPGCVLRSSSVHSR